MACFGRRRRAGVLAFLLWQPVTPQRLRGRVEQRAWPHAHDTTSVLTPPMASSSEYPLVPAPPERLGVSPTTRATIFMCPPSSTAASQHDADMDGRRTAVRDLRGHVSAPLYRGRLLVSFFGSPHCSPTPSQSFLVPLLLPCRVSWRHSIHSLHSQSFLRNHILCLPCPERLR